MLRSNSKQVWEIHIVNPEGEKRKADIKKSLSESYLS